MPAAISTRDGSRRSGHVVVMFAVDGETYLRHGFRYSRGTGKARHDLTVWPSGGALAVGPLGEALSDIAVRAAEAVDPGPHECEIESGADGWTVVAKGRAA